MNNLILSILMPFLLIAIILLIGLAAYHYWPNKKNNKFAALLIMLMALPLLAYAVFSIFPSNEKNNEALTLISKIENFNQVVNKSEEKQDILDRYQALSEPEAKALHRALVVNLYNYPEAEKIVNETFLSSRQQYSTPYNKISDQQQESIIGTISQKYLPALGDNAVKAQVWEANGYIADRIKQEIKDKKTPFFMVLSISRLLAE